MVSGPAEPRPDTYPATSPCTATASPKPLFAAFVGPVAGGTTTDATPDTTTARMPESQTYADGVAAVARTQYWYVVPATAVLSVYVVTFAAVVVSVVPSR